MPTFDSPVSSNNDQLRVWIPIVVTVSIAIFLGVPVLIGIFVWYGRQRGRVDTDVASEEMTETSSSIEDSTNQSSDHSIP